MKKITDWKLEKDEQDFKSSTRAKIKKAINSATIIGKWSYKPGVDFYSQNQWNLTLLEKIKEVNETFKGQALICSPEALAVLEDNALFDLSISSDDVIKNEIRMSGVIDGFFVFVDYYISAKILIIVRNDFFTSENPDCAVIFIENLPW